jgi:23S rRNA (pseudouridine1915-N3)-methyltransferase
MALRIHIVAVGRARQGPERALFEHYAGRVTVWPLALREVEPRGRTAPERLKAAEAELILAALPDGATIVALDETGTALASPDLAGRIATWRDEGVGDLVFVIGGADGLDQSVRQRADLMLSFGRATWPHMLVRGLLAEQLYRAQQILAGHPYHRV